MASEWKIGELELLGLLGSADGQHWATAAETDDGDEVCIVDGVVSESYESTSNPAFLVSGRAIYSAEDSSGAFVVVGSEREDPFSRVSQLALNGDSYAYLAVVKPGKMSVVADGNVVDTYEEAGDVSVSAVGDVAFWASTKGKRGLDAALKGKTVIIRNGEVAAAGLRVSKPTFSAKGELAYLESDGENWTVWQGGTSVGVHSCAIAPVFCADGSSLAWGGRSAEGRWSVMVDGRPFDDHEGVGAIALSADGSAYAYAAKDGGVWKVVSARGSSVDLEGVSTVEVTADGRPAFVAHRSEGLVVGIGEEVFGPFECVQRVRPQSDGRVRFVAGSNSCVRLHVEGAPVGASFESLSDPILVDGKVIQFGYGAGVVRRLSTQA